MATVTISPKFQVVIPREVRDSLGLKPGDRVAVFQIDGRIQLVPLKPVQAYRGLLKGMDTTIDREPDRV